MGVKDNRIGGTDRAKTARDELALILSDDTNKDYFAKDIDFARKYKVSRHTIYKIREQFNIPSRSERILKVLNSMNTKGFSLMEISKKLNIKYQNLYKIIKDNNINLK